MIIRSWVLSCVGVEVLVHGWPKHLWGKLDDKPGGRSGYTDKGSGSPSSQMTPERIRVAVVKEEVKDISLLVFVLS